MEVVEQVNVDQGVYARLRSLIVERIDAEAALHMKPEELEEQVARTIANAVQTERLFLNGHEQRLLTREIVNDMIRLGPIQGAIDDPEVTDVLINGPDQVLVERRGKLELTSIRFRNAEHLLNLAQRITSAVGRRIDESSPMVDARLADGSRVNIIAPPLCLNGICISIRKFSRLVMSLDELAARGAMTGEIAQFLKIAARARLNILVSGGTGSGKTTMLNALSQHIARDERIVTIEDAAELRLDQPFVVRLETRPASLEGKGEVTQRDLLKNALRMRPDRILVGEVRGVEAFDMLQAMNTGHDGSLTTLHAGTPDETVVRLVLMARFGMDLPPDIIREQVATALDLIVMSRRLKDGSRAITELAEVGRAEGGGVELATCVRYRLGEGAWDLEREPAFIEEGIEVGILDKGEVERWRRSFS